MKRKLRTLAAIAIGTLILMAAAAEGDMRPAGTRDSAREAPVPALSDRPAR